MLQEQIQSENIEHQLRDACAKLGRRLRAGESCRAEDLFDEVSGLSDHADAALELIYTEFVVREQLGQKPSPEEWYARFPQWRQDLQELFQVHQFVSADANRQASVATPFSSAQRTALNDEFRATTGSHGRIGNYEILEELGRGGMGVVYKARQLGLNRIVALKMILSGDFASPDELARFRAEAEAAARLQHPNIVQVHEVGVHGNLPFFSMEYHDGGSLQERLATGPLEPRLASELVETLARTVHYAHERGVIHRDLKPANILLQKNRTEGNKGNREGEQKSGQRVNKDNSQTESNSVNSPSFASFSSVQASLPKITDFGLAKCLSDGEGDRTRSGAMLGTPSYMAPEQASGASSLTGPVTDVYALGAILYELLTGRPPFRASTPLETLEQVKFAEPVAPRRLQPGLARDLETICLKCLEKEPGRRYASAALLSDDLRRFLSGEPILARPVGLWERAGKWARRRPAVAALIATVAAVTMLGFAGVTWAWLSAETHRIAAEQSRLAALAAYGTAEAAREAEQTERERIEKLLYTHDIALAYHEYLGHNTLRANQLLERCRPDLRHWEWQYLNRITHSEDMLLTGLTMPIQSLAYSPDGKRIAASSGRTNGSDPGEVRVWDASTGQELFTFRAQRGSIPSLAFSPDGRRLAASLVRTGVRVWDMEDGTELLAMEPANVVSVAFSPDGRLLAHGCIDGSVILCDSSSGQQLRVLKGHDQPVFSLAFSPDGRRLGSGSRDGTARIWDPTDGQQLSAFGELRDVRVVAFSPDGTHFLAATYRGMIKIWQVHSGAVVATHQSRATGIHVAFSPDGQSLALGTDELGTHIWRATTGALLRSFPQNSWRVSFSPDGRRLAAAGFERGVRIWDLTSEPNPREFTATEGARVADMAYSPDGKFLAVVTKRNTANPSTGPNDKTLRIWDVASRRVARVCRGHADWLTSVAFSADGRRIATGSLDKTVRVWEAESGQLLHTLYGHTRAVTGIAFSPDGTRVVSASSDGSLRFWDAATGEQGQTWQGHEQGINCVAYSLIGDRIASGGSDTSVRIWNSVTGEAIASLPGHSAAVNRLTFSRDGKLLASAGADGLINLWEVRAIVPAETDAKPLHTLRGHTEPITGLSFSSDGKRLASAGVDRSVRIWDMAAGDEVITLRSRSADNPCVLFSPDGQFISTSLALGFVMWDSQGERVDTDQARSEAVRARATAWHRSAAEDAQKLARENRATSETEAARQWFIAAFHWSQLIEAEPDQWRLYRQRGAAYAAREQWNKSVADHSRVIELLNGQAAEFPNERADNRELARSHLQLGFAQNRLGESGQAIEQYQRALELNPDSADANNHLAWLLATSPDPDQRDPQRAVELAQKAIFLAEKEGTYWNTLGVAFCRQERWQEAVPALEKSMALRKGGNSSDWFFLSMAHRQLGDLAQARQWCERAVQWMQTNKPGDDELRRFRAEAEALLGSE